VIFGSLDAQIGGLQMLIDVLEIKEQHRTHMKRMNDFYFNFLEKITLHLSLVLAQYLPHFKFVLKDLKLDGCNN
jgi:hypothetical protein